MKGKIAFFLLINFLLPVFVFSAPADHLVINSYKISGETSTDEFIEIYNPTPNGVELAGWRLSRKTSSGSLYNLLTTFPSYFLEPGKSVFVAHKNTTEKKDLPYSTATSLADDNTIILFADQGKTIVDKVGFGRAGDFEEKPAPNPRAGEIYERKIRGEDTGNNLADFVLPVVTQDPVTETEENNDQKVFITEIMPNPRGTDTGNEWIEIYNPGEKLNLVGVSLSDREGSVKKYTFPEKYIEKESYLVLYSRETGISLNNDTDSVEIADRAGKLLDDTDSYDSAKEGVSFAHDGEKWNWSETPTPGSENIITQTPEKEAEAKSVKTAKAKTPKLTTSKVKKPAAKKSTSGVLGATSEADDLFAERPKREVSQKDRILGYILIVVALVGGLLYTLSVNKEKLLEVFHKERIGYEKSWRKIGEKFKRG